MRRYQERENNTSGQFLLFFSYLKDKGHSMEDQTVKIIDREDMCLLFTMLPFQ